MKPRRKILLFSVIFASLLMLLLKFGPKAMPEDQNGLVSSRIIPEEILNDILQEKQEDIVEDDKPISQLEKTIWKIIIPSIGLEQEIKEGTSLETMKYYVGHFEDTAKLDGNIGLAAHNRGYGHNFFAKIQLLKSGDKILYVAKGEMKEFRVCFNEIIPETDWSYLEKSDQNKITLITCQENQPEVRRCVQAVLI